MKMCKMSNCAVQDIDDLRRHASAEDAMVDFCRQNFVSTGVKFGGGRGKRGTLYSFYIFSCPVGDHYPYNLKYGQDFAKFIKANKLGTLWQSRKRKNEAFHNDHCNIIWVWSPNTKRVWDWWQKYKAEHKDLALPQEAL